MPESEIAAFRQRLALEEEAAQLGFSGFAIVSRHDIINAGMERGAKHIVHLIEEGKYEEAQVLMNTDTWGVAELEGLHEPTHSTY